jgi:hypothetical protein
MEMSSRRKLVGLDCVGERLGQLFGLGVCLDLGMV